MAPRNSLAKGKGEKKKKEDKVLPVVMDITVNLPDETHVILKQVRMKSCQNIHSASSKGPWKETPQETSDEEILIPGPGVNVDAELETNTTPDSEQPILEKTSDKKQQISGEILSEAHADGGDGWQPVQRPRLSGSYGQRLKQRQAAIGKVYYQKKNMESDIDYPYVKSSNQNNRYFLKKRTISHGVYTDNHTVNISQGTKFGRKVVKAVAYRVKSMSASDKTTAKDPSDIGDRLIISYSQHGSGMSPNDISSVKTSIVSIGKSPSYKEVALASPGTISKLQVYNSQCEIPGSHDFDVGKHEEEDNREQANANPTLEKANGTLKEKNKNSLSDSLDDSNHTKVSEKKEMRFTDAVQDYFENTKGVESVDVEFHEAVDNIIMIDSVEYPVDSHKLEIDTSNSDCFEFPNHTNAISQEGEYLGVSASPSSQGDAQGMPYRKLSASAAPLNPSPGIARAAPVALH